MILPTKHLELSNSLLSTGALLLRYLDNKQTITSLWSKAQTIPQIKSFDRFTLSLDFLFIIGAVEFKDGFLWGVKK